LKAEDKHQLEQTNKTKKFKFTDLVDINIIDQLLDSFNKITGIQYAILDADNKIIIKKGWQDICTKFHRICPQTESRCRISDSYIQDHLHDGPYIGYKCLNGLMDYACPIIVEGEHLATIFMGQTFQELPQKELFRQQARQYGFEEDEYMKALDRVPIIPEDQVKPIMEFYSRLSQMSAILGLERMRKLQQMEKNWQESEQKFTKAFHFCPDPISISTVAEGRYLEVNDVWLENFGYERSETIGNTSLNMGIWAEPEQRALLLEKVQELGRISNQETKLRRKSGEIRTCLISAEQMEMDGEPHILCTIKDIEDRIKIDMEMARLDRLELVGEMAASIGHEIRNPLTTVRGFLQMYQEKYEDDRETLELMIEELDRANLIITEFLSLARDKLVELKPANLNTIITKILPLLKVNAMMQEKDVVIETQNIPDLLLDEKEIGQLIHNIVNNGLESMPDGGCVKIKTFVKNEKVVLAIEDQGHGVKPEVAKKLGTPFFTTKENGTGMGLPICYGIAKRHNAKIDFKTTKKGTTFFIRFAT
jgi:PAS domain S-box-containing protein